MLFGHGEEGNRQGPRIAAAAAASGDAHRRAARGRGDPSLRAALLARARARASHRRPQRVRAGCRGSHGGNCQRHRRRPSPDAFLRGRLCARGRASCPSKPTLASVCRRCRRVHSLPGACLVLRLAGRCVVCARGPGRPRGGDRGDRNPGVTQTWLRPRPGRLRPLDRLDGDAGDRLLPEHTSAGRRAECGQRAGCERRAAAGGGCVLASRRPRRCPALLRPGGAVRVGPPTQEERCRPTSCCPP